jgi:hypothetical protein
MELAVAAVAVRSVRVLLRAELPPWMDITIDPLALLVTLVISVACGLLAGLYPALSKHADNDQEALREFQMFGGSRSQGRVREGLIAAELALAVVLLVAAGLLSRASSDCRRWIPVSGAVNSSRSAQTRHG